MSFILFILMFLPSVLAEVKEAQFTPADNYLIDCGSPSTTLLDDGRTFKSDPQSVSYLSTDETILASTNSIPKSPSLPLYLTARIFRRESMYRFLVFRPGWHWVRFYFYPVSHPSYNLTKAVFSLTADDIVLLHEFSVKGNRGGEMTVFKEYLVNISLTKFTLKFSPLKDSVAFINALEVVSAPDEMIPDSAAAVSPVGDFGGLPEHTFEVMCRVNVGGPILSPKNDTLGRTWLPDSQFMTFPQGAKSVSVSPKTIKYPEGGATTLVAPNWVYATADQMVEAGVVEPNFNLTWEMDVDPGFSYLIRLHFCDIVSKSLNELYFNVYFNGILGASNLDLSTLTSGLATPYYKDFVLNATAIWNSTIIVQVGPASNLQSSPPNAILNGLEVLKMSNSDGSLDGVFSSAVEYGGLIPRSNGMRIAASVGLAMGLTAIVLLVFGILRWQRRPKGWEKQKTFSSWLPLNASYCSFMAALDPALPREQVNLAEWALQQHRKGLVEKIIDAHLAGTISAESLRIFVQVAEKCLAEYGVDRPSMGDVLWNLEHALQLQDSSSSQEKEEKMIGISEDSGVVVASPIFNGR
nr:probable receptor-like protein kinase At5g61350 [Ipomoea trifida]